MRCYQNTIKPTGVSAVRNQWYNDLHRHTHTKNNIITGALLQCVFAGFVQLSD